MESKKINQLATELAPDLSDLTIIGDPTTGISKKITLSQMASLFTGTVEEYANFAAFPLVGVADTIYIAKDTNVIYRWDSTAYVVLSPNVIASLVFNDANGFDGTIALVGSVATLTITTALTSGSVPFIGASGSLTQDNSNLFFDDTNNRLGIATASPTTALDVFGSGIIGRLNATSTNNSFLGFSSNGTNKWSAGNVQSDHRFRIFSEANSAELITILQTGEFGIGIANPTTKFHIDGAASALIANLDANVSVAKSLSFRSDNSNRFNIEVSGTESGSNAGADFFIRRYSDAGSLIDTPLTITRSTGAITLASALSGTSATFSGILTTPQVKAATSAGLSINANSGTQVADFGAGGSANITFFGGLSGTTATFSGLITSTSASDILSALSSNTAYKWIYLTNTGGSLVMGINNSAGGATMSTAAYASYIFTRTATDLVFGTNEIARLTIASTGAATFTGALSGTTANFLTTTASRYLQIRDAGTSTPSLRSVNDTIAQLRPIAIEAQTISLRTGASSGLTVTEALAISATGAATFSSSITSTSGNITVTSGNLVLTGGSLVTNIPSGGNYQLYVPGSNNYTLYNSNVGNIGSFNYTTGVYTPSSDINKKKDFQLSTLGLDAILGLKSTLYRMNADKDDCEKHLGFIAQEVKEFIPQAYVESGEGEDKFIGLDYQAITSALVKAVQEQQAQIEELKAEINLLKAK